jgi:hypothetical protein
VIATLGRSPCSHCGTRSVTRLRVDVVGGWSGAMQLGNAPFERFRAVVRSGNKAREISLAMRVGRLK